MPTPEADAENNSSSRVVEEINKLGRMLYSALHAPVFKPNRLAEVTQTVFDRYCTGEQHTFFSHDFTNSLYATCSLPSSGSLHSLKIPYLLSSLLLANTRIFF